MPTSGFESRGSIVASVRHGSPEFTLKLSAEVNGSQSFAKVRHSSPALLSELLSKCRLYKCTASVAKQLSYVLNLAIMNKCTSASIAVLSGWNWSREGGNFPISPHRRDCPSQLPGPSYEVAASLW